MQTYECFECAQRAHIPDPRKCAYSHHFKGICEVITEERVYRFDRWIPACREHQKLLRKVAPSQKFKPPKKTLANW